MKAIAHGYFRLGNFRKSIETAKQIPPGETGRDELLEAAQAHLEAEQMEKRKKSKTTGLPILIPYLVPLIIILSILWSTYSGAVKDGKAREIWLVNGSLSSYTVQIDGTDYPIRAQSTKPIELPMGKHTVQIKDRLLPTEPFTFEYDIPFNERVNDENALVLNPDGLAILVVTGVPYVADNANITRDPEPRFDYKFGQNWYVIPNIDWAFSPEKERIDMPAGVNITYKNQLSLIEMSSYEESLSVLLAVGGGDAAPAISEQALRIHPESDEAYLLLAAARSENETAFDNELKTLLSQRPVLIEWHRFYQEMIEQTNPQHDLVQEYQALLDAEPNNPALLYLRGRIEPDAEKAEPFFLAAEEGGNGRGYGYNALAYEALIQMEFQHAYSYAQKSIRAKNSLPRFATLYNAACLAVGNYQPLLESIREQKQKDPNNGDLVAEELRYLYLMKNRTEAAKVSAEFLAGLVNKSEREIWNDYFSAVRYYIAGDIDSHLKALEAAFPEDAAYHKAIHEGNAADYLEELKKAENTDVTLYLIAYGAAMHHQQDETAERALQAAIDLLDEQPKLHDYLTGANNPTPEMLVEETILPNVKLLFATTLGFLHPEQREAYFEIARKCNFSPVFPQLLVDSWINPHP
ncbi:MAG: hypothetical protein JXR40_14575 [Pontiellaceae bacterium]|nr:hypothetical protein [Pontiellaceae bacterium]